VKEPASTNCTTSSKTKAQSLGFLNCQTSFGSRTVWFKPINKLQRQNHLVQILKEVTGAQPPGSNLQLVLLQKQSIRFFKGMAGSKLFTCFYSSDNYFFKDCF